MYYLLGWLSILLKKGDGWGAEICEHAGKKKRCFHRFKVKIPTNFPIQRLKFKMLGNFIF
jgi:hypothetical protein